MSFFEYSERFCGKLRVRQVREGAHRVAGRPLRLVDVGSDLTEWVLDQFDGILLLEFSIIYVLSSFNLKEYLFILRLGFICQNVICREGLIYKK